MSVEISTPTDVALCNEKAEKWNACIGREGDTNRRLNSDPVLWRLAGPVARLDVLDAGCGTGYLSVQLAQKGARVRAVDYSEAMLHYARENPARAQASVQFAHDSISELATVATASIDLIVSNYVLMDCVDLAGAVANFYRVLRPGGRVALVFSHPCFDVENGPQDHPEGGVMYHWKTSYFEERKVEDSWGGFSTPFVFYHRPLSHYWNCFQAHGFQVTGFDEPVIKPPYPPEASPERIAHYRMRPYSIAFQLHKASA